jgi:RHS repeat-associated protein
LTAVRSGASLDLVSRPRWFVTIFLALMAVLVPSRASASMAPESETRTGDFHVTHPVLVGLITTQIPGKHRAIPLFAYDPASDRCFRWKGRPFVNVAGGLYDMRARWWSPQMGAFLTIDQYAYQDPNSTLWGWGAQNPIKWSDPTGRYIIAADPENQRAVDRLRNDPYLSRAIQDLDEAPQNIYVTNNTICGPEYYGGLTIPMDNGDYEVAVDVNGANTVGVPDLGIVSTRDQLLAHELGHVWQDLNGMGFGETIPLGFENSQRGEGPYHLEEPSEDPDNGTTP